MRGNSSTRRPATVRTTFVRLAPTPMPVGPTILPLATMPAPPVASGNCSSATRTAPSRHRLSLRNPDELADRIEPCSTPKTGRGAEQNCVVFKDVLLTMGRWGRMTDPTVCFVQAPHIWWRSRRKSRLLFGDDGCPEGRIRCTTARCTSWLMSKLGRPRSSRARGATRRPISRYLQARALQTHGSRA